jgi:hypothetical protein
MPTSRRVGRLYSVSPQGACGTPGVSPRQRCHELLNGQPWRPPPKQRACAPLRVTRSCGLEPTVRITAEAGKRLRSARGWACRLAACPQELPLLSTRRLVRTDCRPDIHLDRPPDPAPAFALSSYGAASRRTCPFRVLRAFPKAFAPAFVALVPRLPDVPSVIRGLWARHRSGHPHPALRDENGHDAAPRRAGWAEDKPRFVPRSIVLY